MRARVATFEGVVRGADYDEQIEEIRSQAKSGNRPPGLEDAKAYSSSPGRAASGSRSPSSMTRRACAAGMLRSTK